MLPVPMHSANCKVWWRRNTGLGMFFMVRPRPLSSSEGKSERYNIQWHSRWLCASNLATVWGKTLSCFSMSPCTKQGPYRNGLSRSVWKNWTGLHRALTSFGMNWNTDCEPGLVAQHQCPTSRMLFWLNGSKSLHQCSNISWKAFPEEWRLL